MSKAKLICTLGPATRDEDTIMGLVNAGMNVARLNFSHDTYEEFSHRINTVRKISQKTGKPIAILSPQTKSPRTPNPHRLINQLKKYPLGLSWEQAKPLLDDLHLPKL